GGVRINVALLEVEEGRSHLSFSVVDSGIGIPPRLQGRLFDAFEQADLSLSRRYGGSGLGPTIAKGLAEAMGGTIGFESEMGLGSTFRVQLPFTNVESSDVPRVRSIASVVESTRDAPENVIAFFDPFLRHRARVRSLQVL